MTKLSNIIQRREIEPLMLKADKIAKFYEKAANCSVCLIGPQPPDCRSGDNHFHSLCENCDKRKEFYEKHIEAVNEAKRLGGAYIYVCPANHVFWTSPFYSGERFAGALISGSVNGANKNSEKIKALANMMQVCADQISKGVQRDADAVFYRKKSENFNNNFNLGSNSLQDDETVQRHDESSVKNEHENNICLIDMERMLFAHLRRGDTVEGKKMLEKLLDAHFQKEKCSVQAFQLKAIEFAVLLSRSVSNPNDLNDSLFIETNDRYLNKIKESTSYQEITEILLNFSEKISGRIFSFHGVRHFPALRKAERFIWENYTRKLSLEEIAGVSGLSAPYFSTIFREEMGENLSNYLNRLRVEKAAVMLITTNMAINRIAITCGFNDQSWFSKTFKQTFGITPGKYREQAFGASFQEKGNNTADFSNNNVPA